MTEAQNKPTAAMRVLDGVRVLDLSTIVAGPAASMVLADFGAEVIKVERPGCGEDARAMGPHRGGWGAFFTPLNRGKRSIAIDLSRAEGRQTVLRIAAGCDVLLENFRGGKAKALGLDEAAVRASNPEIIYASLSAYGPGGPDYRRPGYDAILQARSGIMSVTGAPEDPPMRAGVSILDMGTGVWMALGIFAALLEKRRSGKGQRVDASLLQTGVMLMSYHLAYRQFVGANPRRQGTRHTAFAPYGAFSAADGAIMIGISGDKAFERLCQALARPEWAADARFRTNPERVRHMAELDKLISAVLIAQPVAYWMELFDRFEVANDPVQDAEQVMADRQVTALDQLVPVELPGAEPALVPRLPIGLSRNPPAVQGPLPRIGEHTRAILRESGYAEEEIAELLRSGVCGEAWEE